METLLKSQDCKMEDLDVLQEIGRGGFATVYLCREKVSNRLLALKRIPLNRIRTTEQKRRVDAEAFLLVHTNHIFLCRGIRTFEDDTFRSFLMEYIDNARPLYQCIWRYRTLVEAIHALGFLHRDLKSGNVLVDHRGMGHVIDYGFATRLDRDHEKTRTYSVCGTQYIMAPEVYLRQPQGVEVDWWGIGVIVHEMVCGRPPWEYKPRENEPLMSFFDRVSDVAKGFSRGQEASALLQAADVSNECKAFIKALLQYNPRKRLGHVGGASEVKAHAWLQDVEWEKAVHVHDHSSPYDPEADYCETISLVPSAVAVCSSSSAESIDAEDNAKFFAGF